MRTAVALHALAPKLGLCSGHEGESRRFASPSSSAASSPSHRLLLSTGIVSFSRTFQVDGVLPRCRSNNLERTSNFSRSRLLECCHGVADAATVPAQGCAACEVGLCVLLFLKGAYSIQGYHPIIKLYKESKTNCQLTGLSYLTL